MAKPALILDRMALRQISDEQFLADCRMEVFRGPGPGGQKRNKTSSAVRLVHGPTGLSAAATEERSQAINRRRALHRLRHRVALELRCPVDIGSFCAPAWFAEAVAESGLRISPRNGLYLQVLGLVLDVLAEVGWSISDAARLLGLSTAGLVRFLQADHKAWGLVNASRKEIGLKTLGD